nr:MAG TPA: hypothetical protein [Bacteriophage sp.]
MRCSEAAKMYNKERENSGRITGRVLRIRVRMRGI